MAKTATINVRVDPGVKANAESTFSHFGITLSDAINIFLHQSIMEGGLPFEMKRPNTQTDKAIAYARQGIGLSRGFSSIADLMEDLDAGD